MSVKITARLNPLRSDKARFESSPKPIAEIIMELNSGFPLSQARVCRNGEIVTDLSLAANDGDTLTVNFVPNGSPQATGGAMKAGGWFLTALGVILGFALPGIGWTIGTALIGAGVSMALGGAVLMNVNTPSLADREKPEQDPSIRGARNQARPGGRIPVLFGRHRVFPDLAANSHTVIDGGQQYYVQLFCGGYKDCKIDINSLKLGETPIKDLSRFKNIQRILSGEDPVIWIEILQNGEASKIYPRCAHEDSINAPLNNKIEDADGNKIPGEIVRSTPDKTEAINVDIFFPGGLGRYNDAGDLKTASVSVKASYKPLGAPDSAYQSLGFFNNSSNSVSGAELKTKRYQITKSGLAPGQYTVKLERETSDYADSNRIDQVYAGSVRSFKSAPPISKTRQKDLTIIAARVMATAKLNGVIDSFNYVASSFLPAHSPNGSGPLYWLNSAETRNPASMLLYALRGRPAQQAVDSGDIDWPSVEAFYAWCEEHDYSCNAYLSESVPIAELARMIGSTARADILRIDSKISVVQDIERPARFQLFTPKNTISYSVTMFNADIPDAISLRYIDEKSGFAHNELPVYNTPDGNRVKEPDTIQKVDLWGITNDAQARRIGMYNYACLKNRPFVHTIETDIEYLIVNKGDWIQYAGDIALTGSAQGRIKGIIFADAVCIGVDTDEPVVMTEGRRHAVRIRLKNGTIILKEVIFDPGSRREKSITYFPGEGNDLYEPFAGDLYAVDEKDNVYYEPRNVILFIEPIEGDEIPIAGDIYAFGVRGYEALDLIITDIQPGQDLTAVLTCVEYSPEIFDVDKPDFILPEFINRVTPVSGAVDSGVINSNKWIHFALFHDSEDEPPRPRGDGQDGGWYRERTFRSVWQSSKTAESIDSGEWGPPARIKAHRGNDDITPVWLALTPESITLETDGDGNVLAGLLPLSVQARLFRWNSLLDDTVFSLSGEPEGVSIDGGLITVAADAVLGDNNKITARAEYNSELYSAVLTITKNLNSYAPRYLGTARELSETPLVFIIKGPARGQIQARQGDFILAVAAIGGYSAGSVFQWSGFEWQRRSPDTHADLYTRCFKDGLDVPELTRDMGWFGAVFARLLIAQQAFIEELSAQVIILRTGGVIKSDNYSAENGTGWMIDYFGNAYFNSGVIGGVTINNETVTMKGRGYAPKYFIYFQLRGRPEPTVLFTGKWRDISAQYAGLFFRVQGGNAAPFEQDQGQSVQAHNHTYTHPYSGNMRILTNHPDVFLTDMYSKSGSPGNALNTSSAGGAETRPVNTTIRIWEKYAEDWE